jgi:ribokinase
MRYDILSLGPARMDVFVKLPEDEVTEVCSLDRKRCMIELGFGEKIPISGVDFAVGGNAGNNAVGMTRLGFSAALVGLVGDGWTDKRVLEELREEGVDLRYMEVSPGQKGFGVVINYQGERTILSYYSQARCCWPADPELDAQWVYLTSMGENFEEFYGRAVEWAKQKGAKVAFNPGGRQIKRGVDSLRYAYEATEVLFVNKEEAEQLLGMEPGTEIQILLGELKKLGPKIVVITDGEDGAYAYAGEKYLHVPAIKTMVVERTGAGDAFGVGFLGAILSGKELGECLTWGVANGASVLGYIGPQKGLLTFQGMQEWLDKSENVKPQEI